MPHAYVGEIRMYAGNSAPSNWAFCDGRLLAISGHEPLFRVIGTSYGGDGVHTFALPDLRGRLPGAEGWAEPSLCVDSIICLAAEDRHGRRDHELPVQPRGEAPDRRACASR